MVYDTTTLNGALMQLAETMANNLNEMGVIDAIPSDGLTTLANKILDISRASNCNLLTFSINGDVDLEDFDVTSRNNLTVLWGDEIYSNYNEGVLAHHFKDGETEHTVRILAEITHLNDDCFAECTGLETVNIPTTVETLGDYCFYACTGLTNAVIPSSVTSLGESCFEGCTSLTTIIIPETVSSLGMGCFASCSNLIDYQLYWVDDAIIPYNSQTMPNHQDTIFTIPVGSKTDYITAGYPSAKLVERNYNLELSSDNPIIAIGDSTSVDILLSRDELPYPNQVLSYMVKHGDNVIDSGVVTTDSSGEASINYTGTAVGDVTFIVGFEKYGMILQKTFVIEDCILYDVPGTSVTQESGPSGTPYISIRDWCEVTGDFEASAIISTDKTGSHTNWGLGVAHEAFTDISPSPNPQIQCASFGGSNGIATTSGGNTGGTYFPANTELLFMVSVKNNVITMKVTNTVNQQVLCNRTFTPSNTIDYHYFGAFTYLGNNLSAMTVSYKNIKVKAL